MTADRRASPVAAARAKEAARIAELKAEISMLEKGQTLEEKLESFVCSRKSYALTSRPKWSRQQLKRGSTQQ